MLFARVLTGAGSPRVKERPGSRAPGLGDLLKLERYLNARREVRTGAVLAGVNRGAGRE